MRNNGEEGSVKGGAMPFDWAKAVVAGLWATVAMTGYMLLLLKGRYLRLDFAGLLGQILFRPGRLAEGAGMALHLVNGVLFAMGYAWVFWGMGIERHWWNALLGTVLGLFHWVISMPLVHLAWHLNRPESRSGEPDPGVWAINYGPQEAIFRAGGHLIFGTVVGWLYFWPATAATWPLALAAALALVGFYAWWNPHSWLRYNLPVGRLWIVRDENEREQERQRLRERYERGEIDHGTYQRERRRYGGEP